MCLVRADRRRRLDRPASGLASRRGKQTSRSRDGYGRLTAPDIRIASHLRGAVHPPRADRVGTGGLIKRNVEAARAMGALGMGNAIDWADAAQKTGKSIYSWSRLF
jgi:hypothetical protein